MDVPVPVPDFEVGTRHTQPGWSYLTQRALGFRQRLASDQLWLGALRSRPVDRFDTPSPPGPDGLDSDAPTYAMKFCPIPGFQHILMTANEEGCLNRIDTSARPLARPGLSQRCHRNAILDLSWAAHRADVWVTVSGDLKAKTWILGPDGVGREEREFLGHLRTVKTVEFEPGSDQVFATGSRDSAIHVWDRRESPPTHLVNRIRFAHKNPRCGDRIARAKSGTSGARLPRNNEFGSSSITAIKYQDAHTLISCADNDGLIKVWDLRRAYSAYRGDPLPQCQFRHPGHSSHQGFTALALNPGSPHLYAACMDRSVYQYNLHTQQSLPERAFIGSDCSSFYVKLALSPEGQYLVSGSKNRCAVIWNTEALPKAWPAPSDPQHPWVTIEPSACLTGHNAEVTCVDWCQSGWKLATCADDMEHRLWEWHPEHENETCGQASAEMSRIVRFDTRQKTVLSHGTWVTPHPVFFPKSTVLRAVNTNSGVSKSSGSGSPSVNIKDFLQGSPARKRVATKENVRSKRLKFEPPSPPPSTKKSPSCVVSPLAKLPCSPRKMQCNNVGQDSRRSPRKLQFTPLNSSITANLPNSVKDASKLMLKPVCTPPKKTNWLTNLSQLRKKEFGSRTPNKSPRSSPRNSPKTSRTKAGAKVGPT
ncbi:hypothetical protein TCAL_09741 [Tigriopus californicus]|uniref:Uncharacterized protein n=1 Tax=Tigriopus californicus TaxID=6832 RepID=A0A553PA59_TIGCA|nr:protein lethal(2)denticleless-like [Tigriopus californicus]TRY74575.1 hypothetical protein TCAL_09741 [Tigriopus californicus]